MSENIKTATNNIVFNIGVIEHFENPANILKEMAFVGDSHVIAIIPESSLFWKIFYRISKYSNLVPQDFFVLFHSHKEFPSIIINAGLTVLWLK